MSVPSAGPSQAAPADSLRLIFSGYSLGEIAGVECCTGHLEAGLARRVTACDDLRRQAMPVVAVEGGDFAFSHNDPLAWEGTRLTAGLMARLGNAAWTPGEWELSFGVDGVRLLADEMRAPVVSANLVNRDGELLFSDARVCAVAGRRVGITGVTAPRLLSLESGAVPGRGTAVVARDMAEALRPVVADLRRECALVIVLAHAGPAEAESLALAVPGIDIMVVGHNPGYLKEAKRVGGARVLRGGNRGQYLGTLAMRFDASGAVEVDDLATLNSLREQDVRDPATAATVDSFMAIQKVINRRAQLKMARDPGFRAGGDHYLGVEVCARCHEAITAQWEAGHHERAFRTLFAVGQAYNPACLPCHTTGFLEPAGAEMPAGRPQEALSDAPGGRGLFGVQCEACHGRGSRHGEPDFRAPITAAACTRCHDAANDPGFDFERAMAAGIHGR